VNLEQIEKNYKDPTKLEIQNTEDMFGGILTDLLGATDGFMNIVALFLVITFLFGVMFLLLAIMMKNGQWQKFGQMTMMGSFVSLLVVRGFPIFIYSIENKEGIMSLFEQTAILLSYTCIFIALLSIATSFLFRFGFRLIEHPDFYRWSKNLFGVAIAMIIFSIAVPFIFPMI